MKLHCFPQGQEMKGHNAKKGEQTQVMSRENMM
jgi:hypothetical protein